MLEPSDDSQGFSCRNTGPAFFQGEASQTHDEVKSQGWTALIIDTNGNGKRDAYVEPNQPLDPTKDKRARFDHHRPLPLLVSVGEVSSA